MGILGLMLFFFLLKRFLCLERGFGTSFGRWVLAFGWH